VWTFLLLFFVQVDQYEDILGKLSEQYEENSEHVQVMNGHLKNVESEHKHSQALVDSKNREIDTESHLRQLAEREMGRVNNDISKINKSCLEVQDVMNSLQNASFVASNKLEQFKLQVSSGRGVM
jgi:chromosome segregation ATPase